MSLSTFTFNPCPRYTHTHKKFSPKPLLLVGEGYVIEIIASCDNLGGTIKTGGISQLECPTFTPLLATDMTAVLRSSYLPSLTFQVEKVVVITN